MKRLFVTILLVVIATLTVTPVFASEGCAHAMSHEATISSLQSHVDHAYQMKHLANRGVYEDLKATLNRAASFQAAGQAGLAVQQLNVFIQKVQVTGAVIDASCQMHFVMQAQETITALNAN